MAIEAARNAYPQFARLAEADEGVWQDWNCDGGPGRACECGGVVDSALWFHLFLPAGRHPRAVPLGLALGPADPEAYPDLWHDIPGSAFPDLPLDRWVQGGVAGPRDAFASGRLAAIGGIDGFVRQYPLPQAEAILSCGQDARGKERACPMLASAGGTSAEK